MLNHAGMHIRARLAYNFYSSTLRGIILSCQTCTTLHLCIVKCQNSGNRQPSLEICNALNDGSYAVGRTGGRDKPMLLLGCGGNVRISGFHVFSNLGNTYHKPAVNTVKQWQNVGIRLPLRVVDMVVKGALTVDILLCRPFTDAPLRVFSNVEVANWPNKGVKT